MRLSWFALLVLLLVAMCGPLCMAEESLRRGWLSSPEDLRHQILPAGMVVVDQRQDRWFVEVLDADLPELLRRGYRFREVPDSWMLSVGGERFDVREGEPALAPEWRVARSEQGLRPYLIKFNAPPGPAWYGEMERAGMQPVQYLPSFGYLVFVRAGSEHRLTRHRHVEFHGEYHPGYKADAALRVLSDEDESVTLRLIYFDLPGWRDALDFALGLGARLVHRSDAAATSQRRILHYVVLEEVPTRRLPELLAWPSVYRAERWFPPQPEGERAAQITAGNVSGGVPLPDYYAWLAELGVDGSGITVAVADTGLDTGDPATLHPDFFGRVTFATALCADNADHDGHGTNVASIAVGDPRVASGGTGLLDPAGFHWGSGSAPGASLYFQTAVNTLCTYNNDAVTLAADAVGVGGAHIGSHSFTDGLGAGAGYNSQAQAWDALVRDADPVVPGNQPYAVLFSAGNAGFLGMSSPKAAKNIITVGATENYRIGECPGGTCSGVADDIDAVAEFSSWGPTGDQRLKPDVVAPGHVIVGARSAMSSYPACACDPGSSGMTCCDSQGVDGTLSYTRYSGTSQAAPRVAGASALIFQWFQQRHGVLPSPAMNKALLINSAVDLKDPDVPNLVEGWGRVSLRHVLQAPEGVKLVDQTTILHDTGESGAFTTSFFVQDPALPLKTTLVWTDPPAAINCRPCLLNDLDLVLTNDGSSWLGNNFADGFSTTEMVADFRNNVEQIHLPPLAVDCSLPIEIKVRANALSGDGVPGNVDATDQDFALVLRNAGPRPGPPFVLSGPFVLAGGCDADVYLDRGETVGVTLDLENRGCRLATGVRAQLRVTSAPAGAVITVSPSGPLPIPDIVAAGASQGTWQVTLEDSTIGFCGQEVVLEVEVTDDGGGNWRDVIRLSTDGEGTVLVANVDEVDTDRSASADAAWGLENCRVTSIPTSWHMGGKSCRGIPRDGQEHTLVFEYTLLPTDELRELTFQHAFNAYNNGSLFDTAQIEIDHDGDGFYTVLELWFDGINNPGVMTTAGPYDLSVFEEGRAETISIRFRFRSASAWTGRNAAPGWDVDDITLTLRQVVCDPQTCVDCPKAPAPVADGTSGGNPLMVEHAGADLRLSWDSSLGATGFNLYAGEMGNWYSHVPFNDPLLQGGESCSEAVLSTLVTMPVGNTYFLVTSDNGCRESGYGEDSSGSPRPSAPVPCNPQ